MHPSGYRTKIRTTPSIALQPRSHRAETFPGHLAPAFRLCHRFQNRCMSRIITRRTPALIDTPPANHPHQRPYCLGPCLTPGLRRTRINPPPPSHSRPLPLPALTPCICAPLYLPSKRPCSSHPSSPSLSRPWHSATHSSTPPPPSFSRQQRPARAEWQTGSIQQVGSSIDGLDRYI